MWRYRRPRAPRCPPRGKDAVRALASTNALREPACADAPNCKGSVARPQGPAHRDAPVGRRGQGATARSSSL
ncbi:hypothetical protein Ga0080559_TMP2282 [Salipiger profundus]|uniref:Uncharacterized protein n=1 Tax=Salipiger profundus TaxID=1229727 RepID=A0A1U7D4Q0_9RHOB|nr:hypothetical protein Ga0080559_TMP2282 [Salipiger profundus]